MFIDTFLKYFSSNSYRMLFFNGLRGADDEAELFMKWAKRKTNNSVKFKRVKYDSCSSAENIWTVNDWAKDVTTELSSIGNNQAIVIGISSGCQAILRAIQKCPELRKNIIGLLLVSPAVLIDFDNYMNRVLFKEAKLMAEGKAVKHPMVDPADQIIIKFDSLSDYVENCVLRSHNPLPDFEFPVRIVHGFYDKIVPCTSSLELFQRMPAKDKSLLLVNDGHVIRDHNHNQILQQMDSLWRAIENK